MQIVHAEKPTENAVNLTHFAKFEIPQCRHQLILKSSVELNGKNIQLGIWVLFCPICQQIMDSEEQITPMTQSEENGGWT